MKKLFPRALLYKEWKNARWALITITLFMVLTGPFEAAQQLGSIKKIVTGNEIMVARRFAYWFKEFLYEGGGYFAWLFILTIGLTLLLFYQDRQETTVSLVSSMPFTRKQAYSAKWLMGVGVLTGAFLINGLLLTGFYFANSNWMFSTPYGAIPICTALHLTFTVAIFSFLLFVQCVMGHAVAAAVVGPIASLVPMFVVTGLQEIICYFWQLSYDNKLLQWFDRLGNALTWPYLVEIAYALNAAGIHYPFYDNLPRRFFILITITVIFTLLGCRAYRESAVEKSGQLLMFPFLEPVLIYGFALCLSLLLVLFFGISYSHDNKLIANVLLFVGFGGGWLIARQVVAYFRP